MRWLWLTAFFSTLFWLRTIPIFMRAQDDWVWFIALAVLSAGIGLRKARVTGFNLRWLLLLAPLAVGLWLLPFPYSVPVVLLILTVVLLATSGFSESLSWVGLPFGLTATVLLFQAAILPVLYIFASRVHEIPALTPLFYWLAKLFDPTVAFSEHCIVIHQVYDVYSFPVRLESLGFIPASLITIAGVVLLIASRRSLRSIASFIGIVVGYSVFRYLLMIFLVVKFKTLTIFWLPLPTALSYAPLIVLLIAWDYRGATFPKASIRLSWIGYRRTFGALGLITAAVICVVGLLAYHDPGTRKQGRLLIDELHSDWEWTTRKYDTEWYGRKSGYNYYCLADYLDHFYTVDVGTDSLLPDLLSKYDVVILKTPTSPYSQREIDALVEFVKRGGGLWLHGDHTNVFGISTHLNQLASRFGLRFRYDSTYDLMTMALSIFQAPPIFRHPTVAFLPTYLFATSCTMEAPLFSENMIIGYALKAMKLDYSKMGFFPEKDEQNYGFGLFLQQGGIKYGKGRVALYTDSTCFSNFFMFIPGKPELALATVEWLNRTNRFAWLNKILFTFGLGLVLIAVVVVRSWDRSAKLALALCGGILGFALAASVYDGYVRRCYPLPQPRRDYVHVAFEGEHSSFTLPTTGLTRTPEISLHTFYVWTQRLGFFPSYEPALEEALRKGDLVVIGNPTEPFSQDELDAIITYLAAGGRLLIILDPINQEWAPAQLLGSLGLRLEEPEETEEDKAPQRDGENRGPQRRPPVQAILDDWPLEPAKPVEQPQQVQHEDTSAESDQTPAYIISPDGDVIVLSARPIGLQGGIPLLRLSDGRVILTEVRIGKGRAFVFSDFYLFTEEVMGHTGEVPDPRKRSIAELEYWMLREIMDLPQPRLFWQKDRKGAIAPKSTAEKQLQQP